MSTSKQLIKELLNHNQDAFCEIYEMYHKLVFYVIYSIVHDKEATKELVQDCFMKVWINIYKYKLNTNFKAWILTIAKNTAKDYLRTRKLYQILEEDVESNLGHTVVLNEFSVDARKVLSDFEYHIIVLTVVYNLKRKEVANLLERPLGTILRVYNEAIKKLRDFYNIE